MRREGDTGAGGGDGSGAGTWDLGGESHLCHQGPPYVAQGEKRGRYWGRGGDWSWAGALGGGFGRGESSMSSRSSIHYTG